MPIYKNKSVTKDGRAWQFRIYYTRLDGTAKQYKSIKYKTKEEAKHEESKFLLTKDSFKQVNLNVFKYYYIKT